MPLVSINTVRFYDPINRDSVRISGFSDKGGEYSIREPVAPAGKSRRLQKE